VTTTTPDSGASTFPLFAQGALKRALYTAVAIAVSYFGGTQLVHLPYWTILSAALMGAIGSLITSAVNLPEFLGQAKHPALAFVDRAVRTFAQALAAGLGTHYLFSQVDWATILQTAAIATFGTLLRSLLTGLPETAGVTTPATPPRA